MGYTITAAQWARYRDTLRSINDRAAGLMQEYVLKNGFVINQELIDYAYSLTTTYGEAAGALAVQLYDEMAEYWAESGGTGTRSAEIAETATRDEVADALFHARDTLGDRAIPQTVEKLVKRTASDTTLKNAIRDGAQFAWIPAGETCAFCLTLASRGWQNASKNTLKHGHAEHIHANCDCQYAVRFDSSTTVAGYDPDKLRAKYDSFSGTPDEKVRAWRQELAIQANRDTMESDLGKFKRRLRSDQHIGKNYYSALKWKFAQGSDDAKRLFTKHVPVDSVASSTTTGVQYFDKRTKKIYMDYASDARNSRGVGATWFHEHGHLIDAEMGQLSKDPVFAELLGSDAKHYRIEYGKQHGLRTFDKVDRAISSELSDMRKHSAVSDLMEAVTKGNVRGVAGHSAEYWTDDYSITAEAFAHMFEAQFDEVRYQEMKKYFPSALNYFETLIKGG